VKRRAFITLLGGAVVAWPVAARAQQAERMRRIDVLMAYAESDPEGQALVATFREGLTGPPSESASDLADFESRHGEAPRFAGKGQGNALDRCRMAQYEGRSAGRLRASSQGGRVDPTPLAGGSDDPPSKTRTPLPPPWFFPA
jgi:hypothetical protein